MVYIAIDIGSTYIKSSLLSPRTGEILNRNRIAVNPKIEQADSLRFEVDMGEMLASVRTILDGYTSARSDIAGILLSTQQHGFVYTTPMSAQARYVSWQDSRCLEPLDVSGESRFPSRRCAPPAYTSSRRWGCATSTR